MKKSIMFFLVATMSVGMVLGAIVDEDFGTGDSWSTDLPAGWTASDDTTSGVDDQQSMTGGSDSNLYAWISGGDGDEHIQTSFATTGLNNIRLHFFYQLFGTEPGDFVRVDWKSSGDTVWNFLIQSSSFGWQEINMNMIGASELTSIDIRFSAIGLDTDELLFLDDIQITGDSQVGFCGDYTIDAGEECDDGADGDDTDLCNDDCTFTDCGDGTTQNPNGQGLNEECDDGNLNDADSCNNNCVLNELCGNGVIDGVEECDGEDFGGQDCTDFGFDIGALICTQGCVIDASGCSDVVECGDGVVEADEQCELPGTSNNDDCDQTTSECLDVKRGTRDAFGDCSQGCACLPDTFSGYVCDLTCGAECEINDDCETDEVCNLDTCSCEAMAECGDGNLDSGEQCDDGDTDNLNECRNDCTLPYCGDGIIDAGESCDDGDFSNFNSCTNDCLDNICGDGIIEAGVEECDDGNNDDGDGCEADCTFVPEDCSAPIDVMLVIDRSGSMGADEDEDGNTRLEDAQDASITFVNFMDFSKDTAGVASFNHLATLDQGLTDVEANVVSAINSLTHGGQTNIGDGIDIAAQELLDDGPELKVMILLSDGAPNAMTLPNGTLQYCFINPNSSTDCTDYAKDMATAAKLAGIELFVIGLDVNTFTEGLLKDIATDLDHYFGAAESGELAAIYLQLVEEICPCPDGDIDPGEECDDGNLFNNDGCTNECKLNVCGDGLVFALDGEECELPETSNNEDCSQTTFNCQDTKSGNRDAFGDCDEVCGCVDDPFVYECVEGQCGAECDDDSDCLNEDPSIDGTCNLESCGCEFRFCGDGTLDEDLGEECDDGNNFNDDGCDSICVVEFCGDGTLHTGEECDDGNNVDGDGCDSTCVVEFCGDEVLQPNLGEECDDGNNLNDDGCNENCILEFCGDNILHTGEECDDGNNVDDDGCDAECVVEFCGDGTLHTGEECDDGNNINDDGCNENCIIESCGDGVLHTGEECDDGNNVDNDGCDAECVLEICGDGIQHPGEECDDGNDNNLDLCRNDCSLPFCGDYIQDANEECDDGNNLNDDGCDADCIIEFCGDGIQHPGEECDDGNEVNGDGCDSECVVEFCGDNILHPNLNEECDDGNNVDGDGCDGNCIIEFCGDGIEHPSLGEECDDGNDVNLDECRDNCTLPFCGDNLQDAGEECDDGNNVDDDGCDSQCVVEFCGDGIQHTGEECDDGNNVDDDGCDAECVVEFCGDGTLHTGEECDDGNNVDDDGCDAFCVVEFCGDGTLHTGEECDDGNNVDDDGCDAECVVEFCGDGILHTGEECDDGNNVDDDGCDAFCVVEFCGDGTLHTGEECDDGNNVDDDGCDAFCVIEFCGDGIQHTGEECDDGNDMNLDECRNNCTLPFCGDELLDAGEECDDGNNVDDDGCDAECVIEFCGDGILHTGEECDDGNNVDDDGCDAFCVVEFCGDGILHTGEECDDGNNVDDDGCDAFCVVEFCGDGTLHTGEECDDGNNVDDDGCDSQCVVEFCGDGILHTGEECDDGNNVDDDGCDAFCVVEFCGDGIQHTGEECDDGNNFDDDGCDSQCVVEFCGDGILHTGEECDDGNNVDDDGCDAFCVVEFCGDGIQHTGEECDDGNNFDDDGCDSQCVVEFCGDGILHTGEECDDGNNVDDDGCDAFCVVEFCGDGILHPNLGEECDDHNNVDGDGCDANCIIEYCGDAITQPLLDEECDDGNSNNHDSCRNDCTVPVCGDGRVDLGEECDDGNDVDTDDCRNNCMYPYCGDGILDAGEECDDGNFNNFDSCNDDCQSAFCGDGFLWAGMEDCDDGNNVDGDGCEANCTFIPDECFSPIDVMLVIDRSGTMGEMEDGNTRLDNAKSAANNFIGFMDFNKDTAGLASFNQEATLDQILTDNQGLVTTAINSLVEGGQTNIGDGIDIAAQELIDNGGDNKVMILLSDGAPNAMTVDSVLTYCFINPMSPTDCTDYAVDKADDAKAAGIEIFVIGLDVNTFTEGLLKSIATDEAHYFEAVSSGELEAIYIDLVEAICPCPDGIVGPGEECDDGNFDNSDECTNECKLNICGDSFVYAQDGEECELPGSTDNEDCGQTTFECQGAKSATRDSFGDCGGTCGCVDDSWDTACVLGQCGAECIVDGDCDDSDAFTIDTCNLAECRCEYEDVPPVCGDGILNGDDECESPFTTDNSFCSQTTEECDGFKLGTRDVYGDCDTFCDCTEDSFVYACDIATCGAGCEIDADCDDSNSSTTDTCNLETCVCEFTEIPPECGDGIVNGDDQCELPDTTDNTFCAQTTEECDGVKLGTRDTFGDCDSSCGCVEDAFVYVCVEGECGAECDTNAHCDDSNSSTTDTCLNDCSCENLAEPPVCGDGTVEGSETCELPESSDNSFCSQTLTTCSGPKQGTRDAFGDCDASCGCVDDAFVYACVEGQCGAECDTNSDCDDSNSSTTDTCNLDTCSCEYSTEPPVCGDGVVNGDDECEDPSTSDNSFCSQTLTTCSGPKQGTRDAFGDCDSSCGCVDDAFGNFECSIAGCSAECETNGDCAGNEVCNLDICACEDIPDDCGDGDIDSGEQCDDGDTDNFDECRNDCTLPYCGDGITDASEECDDGDFSNLNSCTSACETAECGDGFIYVGTEECDDGNSNDNDGCRNDCTLIVDECFAPLDVMLVIDRSGSMDLDLDSDSFTRLEDAENAAKIFLGLMDFTKDKAGLSSFNETATLDQGLTDNEAAMISALNALTAGGQTNIGDGIDLAAQEIIDHGRNNTIMILLSDGAPNSMTVNGSQVFCFINPTSPTACTDYALDMADDAKAAGVEIFVIGLDVNNFTEGLLKDIATDLDHYFEAASSSELEAIYTELVDEICPCPDGDLDPGEECDDGNFNENDDCTNQCKLPVCGDARINFLDSEECELPGTTNNIECGQTTFVCLDTKSGTRDAFGNCDGSCGCTEDPFVYVCVEGQCGAECDSDDDCPGENVCRNDCICSICGDGITDPGEECDDGNDIDDDECRNDCTAPKCGDGTLDPGEECDDNNNDDGDGCSAICITEFCGDGIVQAGLGELCDDGNDNNLDSCRNDCTVPRCGDGIVDFEEECDDGDTDNNDECRNNCKIPYCGDSIIDNGEQCDDGNFDNYDDCVECENAFCGDGFLEVGVEECDDGNNDDGDGCEGNCTFIPDECFKPIDVMFVIDRSGTMGTTEDTLTRLESAQGAANLFVSFMEFSKDTAGVASFNQLATLDQVLTSNSGLVSTAINSLIAGGQTNIGDGIDLARQELVDNGGENKLMILLSDGAPNAMTLPNGTLQYCFINPNSSNDCTDYAEDMATTAKNAGIELFVIGLDVNPFTEGLLKDIATDLDHYFGVDEASELEDVYLQLIEDTCPCPDGNIDFGEDCDDNNYINNDACTNECLDNVCGDGHVFTLDGEECEGTGENTDCGQTTFECQGVKSATRDSYGDCVACGCAEDSFDLACVAGQCGAVCDSDDDCPGAETCLDTCQCSGDDGAVCGDNTVELPEECEMPGTNDNSFCDQSQTTCQGPKYGTRDAFGDCSLSCGCVDDSFVFACSVSECDADCDDNGDCPTGEECDLLSCICVPESGGAPVCGDGTIESPETCELPNTINDDDCVQSTSTCVGPKEGTRDAFGDCNDVCGCVDDSFQFACSVSICSADCDDDGDCDDSLPGTVDSCNLDTCTCSNVDTEFCGNGVQESGEDCDDGNFNNHDDCLNDCTVASCGDGYLDTSPDSTEECDDGDNDNGDGCDSVCQFEEAEECFEPVDVMIVIDRSGTMSTPDNGNTRLQNAQAAAITFAGLLDFNQDMAGIASFNETATLDLGLSNVIGDITTAVNGLTAGGQTNIGDGIDVARQELVDNGGLTKVMIILSDGAPNALTLPNGTLQLCFINPNSSNDCTDYAEDKADEAKAAGIEIFTIGLAVNDFTEGLLIDIATDAGHYFEAADSGDLEQIYRDIAEVLCPCNGFDCSINSDSCNVGFCNVQTDECEFEPLAFSTICEDDGDLCTTDHCDGFGACVVLEDVQCDAPGLCEETNECNPSTGQCEATFSAESTFCETDADLCTTQHCDGAGTCEVLSEVDCGTPGLCEDSIVCNPGTGQCESTFSQESTPCDTDSDLCTTQHCNGVGSCVFLSEVQCSDPGLCEESNECNPTTGQCELDFSELSTPCETDADLCTIQHCDGAGACEVFDSVDCGDPGLCEESVECNPQTGDCDAVFSPLSTECTTDDNECTIQHCDGSGLCVINLGAPLPPECGAEIIKDAKVSIAQADTNFGDGRYMMVDPKIGRRDRSYLRLNAQSLMGQTIGIADLELTVVYTGSNIINDTIEAWYCPDHDFVELGITYNNQPFDGDCTVADVITASTVVVGGVPAETHIFDLKDEVQAEVDTGDGHFTIVLRHEDEGSISDGSHFVQYLTKEYPEAPYRPKFTVTTV